MKLKKIAVLLFCMLALTGVKAYSDISDFSGLKNAWESQYAAEIQLSSDITYSEAMPIRYIIGTGDERFLLSGDSDFMYVIDGGGTGSLFQEQCNNNMGVANEINHSFDNVKMRNGAYRSETYDEYDSGLIGGGAYGFYGSPGSNKNSVNNITFNNVYFESNSAEKLYKYTSGWPQDNHTEIMKSYGGAVFINSSNASSVYNVKFINGTVFSGNTAYNGGGYAAIYSNLSGNTMTTDFTFSEQESGEGEELSAIIFKNNTADGGNGGGIYLSGKHQVNVNTDILFDSNTATGSGGAIYYYDDNFFSDSKMIVFGNKDSNKSAADYVAKFCYNAALTGSGGAVYAPKVGISFKDGAEFISNTAGQAGGALYVHSVYFGENDQASDVVFTGNSAGGLGGAVYVKEKAYFDNGVSFESNKAGQDGGALFLEGNANIIFGGNAEFNSNTAAGFGGAIKASAGSGISFSKGSVFLLNTAGQDGGALFLEDKANIVFGGSAEFNSNTAAGFGGAVYAPEVGISFKDGAEFISNAAGQAGGALYVSSVYFGENDQASDVVFTGNSAGGLGGAVYVKEKAYFYNGVSFESNKAGQDGGALFLEDKANIVFGGNAEFNSNTAAGFGGAIKASAGSGISFSEGSVFLLNTAGQDGGALFLEDNANVVFGGNAEFNSNTAGGSGGAIYSKTALELNNANFIFAGNKALGGFGGAIYQESTAGLVFDGNFSFVNNTAAKGGGAIYSESESIVFNAAAVFDGNEAAGGNGGAIYQNSAAGSIVFANTEAASVFKNNKSAGFGGAVYSPGGGIDFKYDVAFISNSASSGGGALFTEDNTVSFGGTAFFKGNSLTGLSSFSSGGAIYADNSKYSFEKSVFFNSNSVAFSRGGAVYANNSEFTFAAGDIVETVTCAVFSGNIIQGNFYEGGAAVYSNNSVFNFNSDTTLFTDNKTSGFTSVSGGAVYSRDSEMNFKGITSFSGNEATAMGGALALIGSDINFESDTSFASNIAKDGGGAVYFAGTGENTLTFNGNVMFGGLDASDGNKTLSSVFKGGGAVYFGASGGEHTLNFASGKTAVFMNNEAQAGGAVSVYSSAVNFLNFNGDTNFVNNVSRSYGGAVYGSGSGSALYNFEGETLFANNSAGASGGAIYAQGNNTFNIRGIYEFSGNSSTGIAGDGGGAIYSFESSLFFGADTSETGLFLSNVSKGRGGAVYQNDGVIDFYNSVEFRLNEAGGAGGAFYLAAGSSEFFEDVSFLSNSAKGDNISSGGGALYLSSNAEVQFDKNTLFSANNAAGTKNGSGGAVYSASSLLVFGKAGELNEAVFQNNKAALKGGAVYQKEGDTVFNSNASFAGNLSSNGGALYGESAAGIVFNGSAVFSGNKSVSAATGSGGALYLEKSLAEFNDTADFLENSSALDGGAIYMSGGKLDFSKAFFECNNALSGSGGAVYLTGEGTINFTDTNFSGNTAAVNGGAVYARGSGASSLAEIYFGFNNEDVLSFANNEAGGASNALHLAGNAYFEMNIGGGKVLNMNDSITGESVNNKIKIAGGGTFNMNGDFSASYINLELDAVNFVLGSGSQLSSKSLYVSNGADFDAQNGTVDIISVSGNFESTADTNVRLEVFSDGTNDSIAVGGTAMLDGTLYVKAGVGTYDNQWYSLIFADYGFAGTDFADKIEDCSAADPDDPRSLKYEFEYSADGKSLMFVVNGIRASNFRALAKSKNQKYISSALDSVSATASRTLANVIDGIRENIDLAKQMDALTQETPHFISNVINAQIQGNKRQIFGQIKEDKDSLLNIWGHGTSDSLEFNENENSIGSFKGSSYGISFGADKYIGFLGGTMGLFGNYSDGSMEQERSKAGVITAGGGIYGLWDTNKWEFKGLVDFETQSYETKRHIYIPETSVNSTASADFDGFSVGADIESAYKYRLSKIITLRPYAGFNVTQISYDDFTEEGADVLNLEVESGDMLASHVRAGVGVAGQIRKFGFGAKAEYDYLLSGFEPEIKSSLIGTDTVFQTVGAEIVRNTALFNIGADYEIMRNFKIYASGTCRVGDNLTNFYANLGARYAFK